MLVRMKQLQSVKQAREITKATNEFWAAADNETRLKYGLLIKLVMDGNKAAEKQIENELMEYHQGHVHYFTLIILNNIGN